MRVPRCAGLCEHELRGFIEAILNNFKSFTFICRAFHNLFLTEIKVLSCSVDSVVS